MYKLLLQVGCNTPHNVAMTQLAAELLYEPAYDQLRTQEQLGYTVDVLAMQHGTVVGLGLLVSVSHDFDVAATRVRAFLASFERRELARMKKGEFEDARENLLTRKVCPACVPSPPLECGGLSYLCRSCRSSGPQNCDQGETGGPWHGGPPVCLVLDEAAMICTSGIAYNGSALRMEHVRWPVVTAALHRG
jgi:hypothetical protein